MRTIVPALALLAGAQLVVLPSKVRADDSKPAAGQAPVPAPTASPSGARRRANIGWVVLGIGGAVAIGGIVLDVIAAGTNDVAGSGGPGDSGTTHNTKTNLFWGGSTMIVAGVLASVYGGSLIVDARRGHTDARQANETMTAGTSADSVMRVAEASLARAPTFVVPVLGATF